jgi:glycosyltransferase involved in cell wall biosynthesis
MADNPTISIAICTWNRRELLHQTLQQLASVIASCDRPIDVVVVNNNCTDSTSAVIAEFHDRLRITEVHEPTPGLSHARNRALSVLDSDYVAWIDDDVRVDANWLNMLIDGIRRYPDAAAFGGLIDPWFAFPPDPDLLSSFPFLANGFCGLNHGDEERELATTEWLYGANMVYASRFTKGLRFDPNLGTVQGSGAGGEETVYQQAIIARGGRTVWLPGMKVKHFVEPSRMTLSYLTRYAYDRGRTYMRLRARADEPRFLGAPRWTWRIMVESYLRYWALRFTPARQLALSHLREYHSTRGMVDEARSQRHP